MTDDLIKRLRRQDRVGRGVMDWPTVAQQKMQAAFDAEDGRYSPDFPPPNGRTYCGECGLIANTDPDNDVCQPCAAMLNERPTHD